MQNFCEDLSGFIFVDRITSMEMNLGT